MRLWRAVVAAISMFPLCLAAQTVSYRVQSNAVTTVSINGTSVLRPVPSAKIYVCAAAQTSCNPGNILQIYSDLALTAPVTQPFVADQYGNFGFYTSAGQYKYSIYTAAGVLVSTYPFTAVGPSVSGSTVAVESFPGATLAQRITAADNAYLSVQATLTVNTPATLTATVTLSNAHALINNTTMTFATGALLRVVGNNKVSCGSGGVFYTTAANAAFVDVEGNNVDVGNCSAEAGGGTSDVVFAPGSINTSHLRVHDLYLTNVGALNCGKCDDVDVTNISASSASLYGTTYGVVVGADTSHLRVDNAYFYQFADGVEWFNADANFGAGGPTSRSTVMSHGGWYTVSNVQCVSVIACVWGSVAHDITSHHNQATGSSDVSFDCEGCANYTSDGDSSTDASNGGFATFFFSDHARFVHPTCTSSNGSPCMKIYNSSRTPAYNTGTEVSGGNFQCYAVCLGAGGDANDRLTVRNSEFMNAVVAEGDFSTSPSIIGNHFFGTLSTVPAAIAIPQLLNGAISGIISDNIMEANVALTGKPCIDIQNTDFNSRVIVLLRRNRCGGGYTIDYRLTSGSGNAPIGMDLTANDNDETHGGMVYVGFGSRDRIYKGDENVLTGNGWVRTPGITGTFTAGGASIAAGACDAGMAIPMPSPGVYVFSPNATISLYPLAPSGYQIEAQVNSNTSASARLCNRTTVAGTPTSQTYTYTIR